MPSSLLPRLLLPLLLLALARPAWTAEPAQALDFAMADLDGKVHRLSDHRGRWVVINFWASWCEPCLEELPELIAFADANPEHVVLGINFEELEAKHARAFARETGMNFPVLPIGQHLLPGIEPIHGLPTTVIITPAGELIAKHTGPLTRQMLETFIDAESQRQAPPPPGN